ELAPYHDPKGKIAMKGPEIMLNPKAAVTLGMAFHELATNAAKYGALSVENGHVEIAWKIARASKEVEIEWVESREPPVKPPRRRGFGRLLLERILTSDLRGRVELAFAAGGLSCQIVFPLENARCEP